MTRASASERAGPGRRGPAGDEDRACEFGELVGRYRREPVAHCYAMTGSAADAEDLAQETCLRAWRAFDRFEHRSSARNWLHAIAANVCRTSLGGRGRRPVPAGPAAEELGSAAEGQGPRRVRRICSPR